jgi:ribosomal protein S27AE
MEAAGVRPIPQAVPAAPAPREPPAAPSVRRDAAASRPPKQGPAGSRKRPPPGSRRRTPDGTRRTPRMDAACRILSRPVDPEFPRCGKCFSMAWKTSALFFHSVENVRLFFPRCGKCFSTVWKTGGAA